jgi:hypothetical protein
MLVTYGKFISISAAAGTCMDVGVLRAPAATMWASGRNQIGVKIAQAVAGRRSSNTASRQRRQRRVNNRKSFSFSSEAFAVVRIPTATKKKPSPRASVTTSNMRCSLSRLFPRATVARSGKEDCDGSRATTKTDFFNTSEPARKSRSYSITSAEPLPGCTAPRS